MNPSTATRLWAERISLASRQQVALRVIALLAAVAFLALVPIAGGSFHPILSLALVLLALVVALVPDSAAPMFLTLGLGGLWAVYVPETLSTWTLLASADLLVLHLVCTLASYGPPQLVLGRAMFRLWGWRGALLLAVAALVWLGGRVLGALSLEPSGLVAAAALAVLLIWLGYLSVRLDSRDAA